MLSWLSEVEWCLPWNRRSLRDAWRWPHIFWMNIFGWWGEEAGTNFFKKWLPRLRFLVLLHAILFTAAMVVASVEKFAKGDIMTNMFTVFASGIATTGFFKMFQIVIHRRGLKAAMDSIDDMLLEVRSPEAELVFRRGLRRAWAVFTFSLVSGSCVTLHWLTRPVLVASLYGEKSRIVDTWPVLIETWEHFAFSYAFQSPGVCSIGHSFYLFDNVYFSLSQCILSHLEVLKLRLRELSLGEEKSEELAACIRYHDKILRTCVLLRDASTSTIMFQCINTVVMACSGVFVMTMVHSMRIGTNIVCQTSVDPEMDVRILCLNKVANSRRLFKANTEEAEPYIKVDQILEIFSMPEMEFHGKSEKLDANVLMNLIEILLIITVVLYSYCWYSNEITYQCGDVMRSGYMSSWVTGSVRNQRSLHMLMTRTNKPVIFGGILEINLNTFIMVLKTIFSYYNFLMAVAK